MAEEKIKCPHCGKSVELSQALYQDIESRLKSDFETQSEKKRLSVSALQPLRHQKTKAQRSFGVSGI